MLAAEIPTRLETYNSVEYRDTAGRLHRTDGPAYVGASGLQIWSVHGKEHREDGPSSMWPAMDITSWFLEGVQYDEREYAEKLLELYGNAPLEFTF